MITPCVFGYSKFGYTYFGNTGGTPNINLLMSISKDNSTSVSNEYNSTSVDSKDNVTSTTSRRTVSNKFSYT